MNLPSGMQVEVAKFILRFRKWNGRPIANIGHKPLVDWNGEAEFAELRGLPDLIEPNQLPPARQKLIGDIKRRVGKAGDCWCVVGWKRAAVLFIEIKRREKDSIRLSQLKWLETSLAMGLSAGNFALVEWDYSGVSAAP